MRTRAVTASKSQRPGKVRAILASGLVLGIGAAFTLAAWTDNEWVYGGAGSDDKNPGTKTYAMEQNTVVPPDVAIWTDQGSPKGGRLDFTIKAASLLPGQTVYAPFQLRAKAGSEALTVTLAEARQATNPAFGDANSKALYTALRYKAWVGLEAGKCTADGVKTGDSVKVLVADKDTGASVPLNTLGADAFILPAGDTSSDPGTPVDLCFAMTLPADAPSTLQGKNVVPLWRFTSSVGQLAV
jgi:predicted ribosomally synthesized peptide with SipW-like signal peptide